MRKYEYGNMGKLGDKVCDKHMEHNNEMKKCS